MRQKNVGHLEEYDTIFRHPIILDLIFPRSQESNLSLLSIKRKIPLAKIFLCLQARFRSKVEWVSTFERCRFCANLFGMKPIRWLEEVTASGMFCLVKILPWIINLSAFPHRDRSFEAFVKNIFFARPCIGVLHTCVIFGQAPFAFYLGKSYRYTWHFRGNEIHRYCSISPLRCLTINCPA